MNYLRRKLGTALAAGGVLMLMAGLGALPAHGAERAAPLLQPSPRPAIAPVHKGNGSAVQMGHITGTVIDQRTGAPVVGIAVKVGDQLVTTDANGNYDYWLPVGSYAVELNLANGQGVPAQASVMVEVQPNVATVQHLGFTSPAPAAPAAAPAMPTAAAQPTAVPTQAAQISVAASPPNRLPRTAEGSETAPWLWIACGMMLLMAGGFVGFAPVLNGRSAAALLHAQAANTTLLQALLAQPPVDELLQALFAVHERKGT